MGTIRLIGATTENPSFEITSALLSRTRVYVLKPLSEEQIVQLLESALEDEERGLGKLTLRASEDVLKKIASYSSGDARSAYNVLEVAAALANQDAGNETGAEITPEIVQDAVQKRILLYDKAGEEHYNLISALHKSVRNSDPDASLYWLGRMLEAGEDPLYIVRRMIRFASEDIGNADPQALVIAVAAMQAVHFVGMPEGNLALAQAAVYLATAPKSNALYTGYASVQEDIRTLPTLPVPLHLRNAPTGLMKGLGYGRGYKYPHHYPGRYVEATYLPENLQGRVYYEPVDEGYERVIGERLRQWRTRAGDHPREEG
jgi:putative ATPase